MPRKLLLLLSAASDATSVDGFVEAMLRAWMLVVRADYYSLIRFSQLSGTVTHWEPGVGRLGPNHWLPRLFARLLATEQPMGTHPSTEAFLKCGPGAYLRSAIENDNVWRQRPHYRLVDSQHGIEDMVSLFLVPSDGFIITLHAGSKGVNFEPTVVGPAQEFAAIANALIAARRGLKDQAPAPIPQLTKRETEILQWVGEGKRNAEIATILGLSAHTVRNHLENIFAKLGVETRTAAALALSTLQIPRTTTTTKKSPSSAIKTPRSNRKKQPRSGAC